jgi:uncharacterized protein (DUF1810 family)
MMDKVKDLNRFISAQQASWENALLEVKRGRKTSHWMWYVFPQIKGLGMTETSKFYAIEDLEEAREYLAHPVLGQRLITISSELLQLNSNNAGQIFGSPDNMKLKSSMTLFALVENTNPVFQQVLEKFFGGTKDDRTLKLLG